MKTLPPLLFILVFLFLIPCCLFSIDFWDKIDDEKLIESLITEMKDEELLAQVFLIGWYGQTPSPEIIQWIESRNIGGIKIFGWNGKNLRTLVSSISTMQKTALDTSWKIPLFTATDQEGGIVRHVQGETTGTPGNMAIGATRLPYDAYMTGYYIGKELRAMGINMNFAPTVDVYINPEAKVIGSRAFSDDPVLTGTLGVAYYKGLEKVKIISAAKHFPGHGNAHGDSHGMLPVINDSFEDIWDRDLLPYRFLIPEGIPAILSGHLNFPLVTDDGVPASLSKRFITEILKERMDFKGIVITDSLNMLGAQTYGEKHNMSFGELCIKAITAGSDMILLNTTPLLNGEIWNTMLNEFHNNDYFRSRVLDAVRRILKVKLRYLKPNDRVPFFPSFEELKYKVPDQEGKDFFQQQALRSITVVRDQAIPYVPDGETSLLITGQDHLFLKIGKNAYPSADTHLFRAVRDEITDDELNKLLEKSKHYDTVIFCLQNEGSLTALKELKEAGPQIIVFSILTPVYLKDVPWVETAIAAYGWWGESYRAGFSCIRGDYTPEGVLPVKGILE
jgi:beta-N-acetylhexosaminidase